MLLGLCLVQVVLWVGLGILMVSTHTTLSVSEEAPVDLAKEALAGRLEEAEGIIKAEAARLPGTRLPGMHTAAQPRSLLGAPAASSQVVARRWCFQAVLPAPVPSG